MSATDPLAALFASTATGTTVAVDPLADDGAAPVTVASAADSAPAPTVPPLSTSPAVVSPIPGTMGELSITINGYTQVRKTGGTYTENPASPWFHYWWPLPGEVYGVSWWPNDDRNNPAISYAPVHGTIQPIDNPNYAPQEVAAAVASGAGPAPTQKRYYWTDGSGNFVSINDAGNSQTFASLDLLVAYCVQHGETPQVETSYQAAVALLSTTVQQKLTAGNAAAPAAAPANPSTLPTAPAVLAVGQTVNSVAVVPGTVTFQNQIYALFSSGAGHLILILLALWVIFHLINERKK